MFNYKLRLADGTVLYSGQDADARVRSVTLTERVNDQDDLCPGAVCTVCADIELWAPQNRLPLAQGAQFTLVRVDTETGAETQVGVFLAERPVKTSANVYTVTAYDRMTRFDKDLSPWLRAHQGDFPLTIQALVEAVCTQCGVTLADGALDGALNTGYAVQAFYADDLTGRQLIQWAAQAMGRFARATPAGDLEFAWYEPYTEYGAAPGSDAEGTPTALGLSGPVLGTVDGLVWTFRQPQHGYFQGGLSYEDYETAPLDKVQIKQSDDDVGVVYPPDESGTNALVIQGNLLLTTASADALRPVAQALYEQLHSVTYTPLQVTLPLTADAPAPGKIITVTDAWGRTMQAYIMQRTVSGQRVTLESTGNARRDGTAAVNSQTYQNLQGKMLELQIGVDGLKVTASELQGDYAQLELTVDGISTTVSNVQGDMTSLEQTVDGLELTVVKDGEVRTAFAADSTSVTIRSGTITFDGNTLVVDSENFQLTDTGDVEITGTLNSNNGTVGAGRNEISLYSGGLMLYRTPSSGSRQTVASLTGWGTNGSAAELEMYCSTVRQVILQSTEEGGIIELRNGFGDLSVRLNGSTGSARFTGPSEVASTLNVSSTVTCQNLSAWGEKSRIVPTSFGALKMAALETPEPAFADSGEGCCDEDGLCYIAHDPRYAETLDRCKALQWLATPTSPGALWVEGIDGGAVVHGQPGQTFAWLCLGAQAGYAGSYAEPCHDDPPKPEDPGRVLLGDIDRIAERDLRRADDLLEDTQTEQLVLELLQKGA